MEIKKINSVFSFNEFNGVLLHWPITFSKKQVVLLKEKIQYLLFSVENLYPFCITAMYIF